MFIPSLNVTLLTLASSEAYISGIELASNPGRLKYRPGLEASIELIVSLLFQNGDTITIYHVLVPQTGRIN